MTESKIRTLDELIIKTKQEMKRRGITQKDLAELTGVPKSTLSKILCGETKNPQEKTIIDIANGLNIDVSELDVLKSAIPHNRFNPNRYFTNVDFETFLNEIIEKINQQKEELDDTLGLLLTIQQGIKTNKELEEESEQCKSQILRAEKPLGDTVSHRRAVQQVPRRRRNKHRRHV